MGSVKKSNIQLQSGTQAQNVFFHADQKSSTVSLSCCYFQSLSDDWMEDSGYGINIIKYLLVQARLSEQFS